MLARSRVVIDILSRVVLVVMVVDRMPQSGLKVTVVIFQITN